MAAMLSPSIVKNELVGLLEMYDASLQDPSLRGANIHIHLAFAIADIRSKYVSINL